MPPVFRSLLAGWVVAFSTLGAPTLAAPADGIDGVAADEIRIGMVNAQSGPASGLGRGMREGAQAVFDDVNAAGGIHRRMLRLVVSDDGYEPQRTVDETLLMLQQRKVFSLFGFVGTPTTHAVLPLIRDLDVPLIGVFSGAGTLRSPLTRQLFNTRVSYDDETEAIVERLLANGARSVAVVHQFDGFGVAVLAGTEKALKRRGLAVTTIGSFQRNTLAVKMAVGAMLEAQPDAVVIAGTYAPVAAFIQQARAAGLKSRMATVSFVGTHNLLELMGREADGLLISQVVPYVYDTGVSAVNDCRRVVSQHLGVGLNYVNLEGCLSARVLVAGLERAGPAPTRALLIDAMESMKALDLGGFEQSFSATEHQGNHQVFMTQIQEGRVTRIR